MKKRKRNGLGKFRQTSRTFDQLQRAAQTIYKRYGTRKENQKISKIVKSPPNKYYPHSTKTMETRIITTTTTTMDF